MNELQPHQQRIVDEKRELDEKLDRLKSFINESDLYKTLDSEEQDDLRSQSVTMKMYSHILEKRINRFKN